MENLIVLITPSCGSEQIIQYLFPQVALRFTLHPTLVNRYSSAYFSSGFGISFQKDHSLSKDFILLKRLQKLNKIRSANGSIFRQIIVE